MDFTQMRTWAECSETALAGNFRTIKKMIGPSRLLGVVKADAYGHGAVAASRILIKEGAVSLAVASLSEALELRHAGISVPILVLGSTPPEFFEELVSNDLTQTVVDFSFAERYSKAAQKYGKTLKCHIKLDTGMSRLGITELSEAVNSVMLDGLCYEGAFSHFSVSDLSDGREFTLMQLEKFKELVHKTELASGVKFGILHMANSGGIENFPESHLDMSRPGIVLYGYPASGTKLPGIEPVMELKTRVAQVKRLKKGESVSYGRRFTAPKPMTLGVLPIGYADGLSRSLSGRMSVLINGGQAPQTGTICMDMCMVDLTGIPGAEAGQIATIFGRETGFTARDMAEMRGSLPHEVLCNIGSRVPRVWVK